MNERSTYDDMCQVAATAQGLDPIARRLAVESIPYRIEQTGGFVMLIRVPLADPAWIGVTASDEHADDAWYVVLYHDDADEGTLLSWDGSHDWPSDAVVAVIQEHIALAGRAAASPAEEVPEEPEQRLRQKVDGLLGRIYSRGETEAPGMGH